MPFMCYYIAFKAVFIGEENLLAKMVSNITGIYYEVLENNIILEVIELPISTIKRKLKDAKNTVKTYQQLKSI